MRSASVFVGICALLFGGPAVVPSHPPAQTPTPPNATPLILEQNEGERRVWRPIDGSSLGALLSLFTLKVDPSNGGSSHLVFGTEDMPPGGKIDAHRHAGADEILFLQNGSAKVTLGDAVRDVHGGATIFIPANTWISASNTGKETIHLVFVFSAPGFNDFMRAESVPEGERVVPLTKAEDAAISAKHSHDVVYREP
jgi:quercetin dioxygenase-like cupin family protein